MCGTNLLGFRYLGGYFELEFELWTEILFDKIKKKEFRVIFSEVLEGELKNAPERVRKLVELIPNELTEFVSVSDKAIDLANKYILEEVVGKTSFAIAFILRLLTYKMQMYY